MNLFLSGVPTSRSRKPITFQENKLTSGWTQNKSMHVCYCKFWTGIAPCCLNDIFMPSLNNYNTKSQTELHIPLCRINKGQKSMSFLGAKIWNMLSSNIKAVPLQLLSRTAWKKRFLKKCIIEKFYWFLLTVDFFIFRGTLMEIRTVLDLFYVIPAIFDLEVFFALFFASDLAKYFSM